MKKIATALAAALAFAFAIPAVLACPQHENKTVGDKTEKQEPQTAEKDKAKTDGDKAQKDAPKKDTAPAAPKADGGKVSRR